MLQCISNFRNELPATPSQREEKAVWDKVATRPKMNFVREVAPRRKHETGAMNASLQPFASITVRLSTDELVLSNWKSDSKS
jgi:hypothetical protein